MAPEVKTAKNSKLPKMSENYFELVGKGGWPPISIWITIIPLEEVPLTRVRIGEETTIAEIPSTIPVQVPYVSENPMKSMEDVSIQGEEIIKLQEEVKNLQDLNSMFQSRYHAEMHKSRRLSQQLQQLQKEIVMAKTISEANENIWVDISKSMEKIWPFIQIIFEQHDLV